MAKFVQPTFWILSGGGVHVRYSTAGPPLHYQHHLTSKEFSGSELDVTEVPELGTLVSATLELTVDSGSTTF